MLESIISFSPLLYFLFFMNLFADFFKFFKCRTVGYCNPTIYLDVVFVTASFSEEKHTFYVQAQET